MKLIILLLLCYFYVTALETSRVFREIESGFLNFYKLLKPTKFFYPRKPIHYNSSNHPFIQSSNLFNGNSDCAVYTFQYEWIYVSTQNCTSLCCCFSCKMQTIIHFWKCNYTCHNKQYTSIQISCSCFTCTFRRLLSDTM